MAAKTRHQQQRPEKNHYGNNAPLDDDAIRARHETIATDLEREREWEHEDAGGRQAEAGGRGGAQRTTGGEEDVRPQRG